MCLRAIKQNKNRPPFYNEGDESTRLVGSGLCICFKAHGLRSMGYLFLNEQKEKIQPTHRSGMGFKAIKQNGLPHTSSVYPPSFLIHKITLSLN